jgi:predicted RNase H-like HicB family nuclease
MHGRTLNLWAVLARAPDVSGWVAHCLDLHVVTVGDTFTHALQMLHEATTMTLEDDQAAGIDSFTRRAPDEYWNELRRIQRDGKFTDALPTGEPEGPVVLQLQIQFAPGSIEKTITLPVAWKGDHLSG